MVSAQPAQSSALGPPAAEQQHPVAHPDGPVAHVDDELVHGDAARDVVAHAIDVNLRTPGRVAGNPVRVAERHEGERRLLGGHVVVAVRDALARGYALGRHDRGRELHRRAESREGPVVRREAVHADAEPHHPEAGGGGVQGGARGREVHELRIEARRTCGIEGLGEHAHLGSVFVGAGVREVAPHSAHVDSSGALVCRRRLDEGRPPLGGHTVATEGPCRS